MRGLYARVYASIKFLFIQVLHNYPFVYRLSVMDKDIATLLREIKSATSWSEPQIAAELGTSQPTVNRILNGQPDCKGSTFRAIESLHAKICPVTPTNPSKS